MSVIGKQIGKQAKVSKTSESAAAVLHNSGSISYSQARPGHSRQDIYSGSPCRCPGSGQGFLLRQRKGRQSDGPIVLFAGGIKKRKMRLRTLDIDCHSRP